MYDTVLGETVTVGDAGERGSGLWTGTAPAEEACILQDTAAGGDPRGPDDIGRIVAESGLRARPMRDAVHDDRGWIAGPETA